MICMCSSVPIYILGHFTEYLRRYIRNIAIFKLKTTAPYSTVKYVTADIEARQKKSDFGSEKSFRNIYTKAKRNKKCQEQHKDASIQW
jgi:hypothetical protein